ncbi:unnamed protein product [Arabidopsis halleri]
MTDSTMAISDLPRDLVEEVLSRVPLTSLRAVRTTCKNWNSFFKHRGFTKRHIRKSRAARKTKEFLAIMMMDSSLYLMSVGIHKDDDYNAINRKGKLISLNDVDGGVDISNVFHCSGLLLCTTKDKTPRLVVWNPYRGKTRWIETTYRDDFGFIRFGPRLSLPFHSSIVDSVTLSSVRDEQLAVLFQRNGTLQMEIWITSNIEPEAASWSMLFLVVDKKTLLTYDQHESFFVDEEKKVVMVFAKDKETKMRNVAYCYGEDGYFETVVFGESTDKNGCPLVCSYVPSSVQIK